MSDRTSCWGDVEVGSIVLSLCGRDQGRYYVVVAIQDNRFVSLADGRKVSLPQTKRKNCRHLKVVAREVASLQKKLGHGDCLTDIDIRAAIKELQSS